MKTLTRVATPQSCLAISAGKLILEKRLTQIRDGIPPGRRRGAPSFILRTRSLSANQRVVYSV